MANDLLKKLVLGTAITGSALLGAKNSLAEVVDWSTISDIVPEATGESINYTSSNSTILPYKLVALCYLVDPSDGTSHLVGGFDLENGTITKGYYNKDWNQTTGYGLNTGDTANTGSNSGSSYTYFYEVFYDSNNDDILGTHSGEDIYNRSELVDSSKYSITGFTPYGSSETGTFTFTYNDVPEPSTLALLGLGLGALGMRRKKLVGRAGNSNIYDDGSIESYSKLNR